MKKTEKKPEKTENIPYMMNRELSWLKFNERVLNEAGNPRVPLAERLTFASIYQSNLDEFYRVRVGTLMDQMESSEVVRENKTNMTSEEQVKAILKATRELDQKKAVIYEQLMGELEPKGVRLINFNRLSAEEGKLLETYFDHEIAPYLSANIVSKQQPFPFLKNKDIYAVVEAAENGKEVVVLVELRARFDEESNIIYSRILEEAGCRVIYGLNGYKVHSKLCLISRKTETGVSYITQIGTGNYNEKTSALYTDLSLITANQEIGKEAAEVFAALLKGETVEETNHLLVAPKCLQNKVLDMMDEEIAHVKNGEEGYIGIKINSLTDKVIINKLIEASQAGVKIEMIVRGICCLIPGVEGYTENIKVVSIVGRFLEHSRIYRFGTKEREKVYIASADFMTRNTVRRVEVAAPVLDEKLKKYLDWMFETMMNDDEKGKCLTSKGNYVDQGLNDMKLNSQEMFYAMAYSNAEK